MAFYCVYGLVCLFCWFVVMVGCVICGFGSVCLLVVFALVDWVCLLFPVFGFWYGLDFLILALDLCG